VYGNIKYSSGLIYMFYVFSVQVKPLKELSFNSPNITATMTSRQFQIMVAVISNLLLARLPKWVPLLGPSVLLSIFYMYLKQLNALNSSHGEWWLELCAHDSCWICMATSLRATGGFVFSMFNLHVLDIIQLWTTKISNSIKVEVHLNRSLTFYKGSCDLVL